VVSATKNMPALPPKSPFLAPRRVSSKDAVSSGSFSDHDRELDSPSSITPPSINRNPQPTVEPEHKSTLVGCTANLITAIVGAGIVGIPYAMKETGLVAGTFLILLSGALGCKSLRLLVETAKHVDAPSYEILCEATFGSAGWAICNVNMFMMSWGPMLSYMMIVKDTAGKVLGFEGERAHNMALVVSSVVVMLPLSLQRVGK
jgi:sodium-coupled neutral amino acid transporter 11